MEENVIFAFLLTLFAGLSTGIGSLIALFAKKTNTNFLSIALSFSAGVMIYVSFIEIFPKAGEYISSSLGDDISNWMTVLAFFFGIFIIWIIDKYLSETPPIQKLDCSEKYNCKCNHSLLRMGIFTALAVAIHNFPEGLATFMSTLSDPELGISIAIAIAIHNIPEGLAVSTPIYYATKSKLKAFIYSFLSGISEPIGAVIGYLILRPILSDAVTGFVFAAVAGIMVYISLNELLPTAKEYGKHNLSIFGLILGMATMAISLILM